MKRSEFIQKGIYGLGTLISVPVVLQSCVANVLAPTPTGNTNTGSTTSGVSPSETKGPFPIKTPAELVRENIVSDRSGIPLLIQLKIQNHSQSDQPLANTLVDLWHCDANGDYSEYGNTGMQRADYTTAHFLRGRQTTNAAGEANFISIYPGWYRGRAPHIHVEVLSSSGKSLLVTQIAFTEDISNTVYATTGYNGPADTSNTRDNVFSDSLTGNMADSITGNTTDGYTLTKTITVQA